MSKGEVRTVTVDRISNADNPVTKEGLHVYGGEPGQKLEIRLSRKFGLLVGEITNPTKKQKKNAKKQVETRENKIKRRRKKKRRKSKSKKKMGSPHKRGAQEKLENKKLAAKKEWRKKPLSKKKRNRKIYKTHQ